MTSKTKAILISTCVPIALVAYYCWLSKRRRSRLVGKTEVGGVEISDILAVIDKKAPTDAATTETTRREVTWTVQNSTRVRLRRSRSRSPDSTTKAATAETDSRRLNGQEVAKMNDEVSCEPEAAVVALDPKDCVDAEEVDVAVEAYEDSEQNVALAVGDGDPDGDAEEASAAHVPDDETHERDSATHSPSRDLAGTPHDPCAAGFSDNSSEVSSDSGKGGSEIANLNSLNYETSEGSSNSAMQPITLYEFELAQPLVGLLIGKYGCNVHEIYDKCGAHVVVRKHPCNYRMKLITVEGTSQQIDEALVMIRRRFPPKRFPEVTLNRVDYLSSCLSLGMPTSVIVPATFQLHLPASVMFDAYVSAVVSGGQLFLQQPTHPTYSSLKLMDQCMNECYADSNCPGLPRPLDYGMVCAAPAQGGWYRAQVVSAENELQQVTVKFLDYGGYAELPASGLRQIRLDFMSLPFQGAECYLANIIPVDSDGENEDWKPESAFALDSLCSGVVLQAEALGFTVEGVSVVNLYRVMEDGSLLSINREMVNRGFARWMETPEEAGYAVAAVEPELDVAPKDMDMPRRKSKGKSKKKRDRKYDGYNNGSSAHAVDDAAKLVKDLSLEA